MGIVPVEFELPDGNKTQFNGAMLYLLRVHKIMEGLDNYTANRNSSSGTALIKILKDHFWLTVALFKELYPRMKDKEREEHLNAFKLIREEIEGSTKANKIVDITFSRHIDEWELELRAYQKKIGMDMPDQQDPRFAMGGGG